jgi:hypothetical protein
MNKEYQDLNRTMVLPILLEILVVIVVMGLITMSPHLSIRPILAVLVG